MSIAVAPEKVPSNDRAADDRRGQAHCNLADCKERPDLASFIIFVATMGVFVRLPYGFVSLFLRQLRDFYHC